MVHLVRGSSKKGTWLRGELDKRWMEYWKRRSGSPKVVSSRLTNHSFSFRPLIRRSKPDNMRWNSWRRSCKEVFKSTDTGIWSTVFPGLSQKKSGESPPELPEQTVMFYDMLFLNVLFRPASSHLCLFCLSKEFLMTALCTQPFLSRPHRDKLLVRKIHPLHKAWTLDSINMRAHFYT